jgi:PadR family transcriptional regulator AphA
MSLRYALLALLTAQPMTGYDVAKTFHSSVGHVWHAPDSQIYPELKRMELDGLIRGEDIARSSRAGNATKRLYGITDEGVAAFRQWMSFPTEYSAERNPAHLRAAYFEWADAASVRAQLLAHIEHWTEMREQWVGQLSSFGDHTHPIFQKRLEISPPSEWPRITAWKVFAYEGLIAQADQQIAWAEKGLQLEESLDA